MACDEDKMLSNKLAILVNDIAIAMGKLGYGTYRGKIYKRDARSMFTFSYMRGKGFRERLGHQ
jgi:hypothetical protein